MATVEIPDLLPAHADLRFMSPLSQPHADRLVDFLATDLTGTVVDAGCGWAELLLQVLQAAPGAVGVGIDLDETAVEHGRGLAAGRGLTPRTSLVVGDVVASLPAQASAAICVGASQIWGPPVEERQPLDYRSALAALRRLLPVGGRLVYGEAIWSAAPTEAAIAPLAGRPDEFVSLAALLAIAVDEGFAPVQVFEATLDEWDEFESGYAAGYARWLADHPTDHPAAAEVRDRAQRQRLAYFEGYRGILGMGYLGLLAV